MKIEGQAIYGSSVHRVVLEFEGDPSPSISGIVKFYERDQLDLEKSFNSFQRLVEIVKEYWEKKQKQKYSIEDLRLGLQIISKTLVMEK